MALHPSNFKLRDEIGLAPPDLNQRLCDRANGMDADGTPSSLVSWLDILWTDAEALLEQIAKAKQKGREERMKGSEVDRWVRSVHETAKPTGSLLQILVKVLEDYHPPTTFSLDKARGKIAMNRDHSADATNEQLVAFMLCVAVNTGEWKRFRRCAEPKCDKFFFDASTGRGRNPRTYCCSKHQKNHAARLRRR